MNYCSLNFEDFKRVFDFSNKYYLSGKSMSDRTNGNPRSLGAIMDAFSRGKLTEIGVEKILYSLNNDKKIILDFDIHEANSDPDIIKIEENNIIRDVNCFVEIKTISINDRWIGLTEEQFQTIKRSAGSRNIYIIFASLNTKNNNISRTDDLTGMFLKEIEDKRKSEIFQKYADINAEIKIEFIIKGEDLQKFGCNFERGNNIYETNLFEEKKMSSIYKKDGDFVNSIEKTEEQNNYNGSINIKIEEELNEDIYKFSITGSYIIYKKKNSYMIETLSNVFLKNKIFGSFNLESNKIYSFKIPTLGRDLKLKRNNIFIAKRKVYELINNKEICSPDNILKEISEEI